MMKKMKRVTMESSPSYAVDEEAKSRFKMQGLMQDFGELYKETHDLKKKLEKAKQKKMTLLAEVRFLRRRYKHLMRTSSQINPAENLIQQQKVEMPREQQTFVRERKHKEKESAKRNPPTLLDLNEVSVPREENGEFQVVWEPLRMDKKLKRCSVEGETLANDLNLSICRDVGNGSSRNGKRKITWQDQKRRIKPVDDRRRNFGSFSSSFRHNR
ncbi:hypothetical protein H6P81_000398 [Aristolochia fimbriata]|uniref:Uncharacterized protein n=1 Tax=Aristolochia fimbriata TaxID=158543 RepID=A0AAV7F6I5_ARIFI|nr:hypothetical protein H6P81_000398 [Aristolochia fimbriata]